MTAWNDNRSTTGPAGEKSPWLALTPWLAALAALVGRLPALGAYWNQDDWGLLGRAAGVVTAPESVRWLSRVGYWDVMWPLAGLDPVPYAWTRLLLHGMAAGGVVDLARRLGLSPLQALVAGLIMAASPLAFTSLYWAAGVQDLLAVTLAVWALALWCRPGIVAGAAAVMLAAGAVFAKETVVGLPLIMLALAWWGPVRRRDGIGLGLVLLAGAAAALAAFLAARGFDTSANQPYALGSAAVSLGHLLTYGWWLLQPGPVFSPSPTTAMAAAGGALWLVWLLWGVVMWRRGLRVPAVACLGALITLGPLLPLTRHLGPDLAYPVEPFGCLALASLLRRRWPLGNLLVGALVLASVAWGFLGMRGRLSLRDADGMPSDPVVRRTAVSWQFAQQLPKLPLNEHGLVLVQPPLSAETAAMAMDLGEDWVLGSALYHSLDGVQGPRLLLGPDVPVQWANGLRLTPTGALVIFDAGGEAKPWGFTDQALLYMALTDVGLGHYDRARLHLLRAGILAGDTLTLLFDPGLLPVPLDRVLANKQAFIDHLYTGLSEDRTAYEVGGVQTNFFRLLSACTGIDEETLRAGGHFHERTTP